MQQTFVRRNKAQVVVSSGSSEEAIRRIRVRDPNVARRENDFVRQWCFMKCKGFVHLREPLLERGVQPDLTMIDQKYHLPGSDRREPHFGRAPVEKTPDTRSEPARFQNAPDEDVRVEEESHSDRFDGPDHGLA